jgi:hypothetical protein
VTVIVALHEFDAPAVPIVLEEGLEIDELSEPEVAAALSLGAGQRAGLRLDERVVSKVFGIRTSIASRLFIDGVPQAEATPEMAVRTDARERAEFVLVALRLFKAGRVASAGSFEYATSWEGDVSPTSGTFLPSFGWHAGEPYVLAVEKVPRFREFWSMFNKAHARVVIAGALRRFNFAADRTLPDDEIVDLMVAAESLFLSKMDDKYRGELSFRLATRAASLLGTTLDQRLRMYEFMRRAYNARSVIVHGGTPRKKDLRGLNGERVPIHAFADDLEGALRDALKTAIRLLATGKPFPPDWEKLMFAGPEESGTLYERR